MSTSNVAELQRRASSDAKDAVRQGKLVDAPVLDGEADSRLHNPIGHQEIVDNLRLGRTLKDVLIESVVTNDGGQILHLLFVSCNYRPRGYRVYCGSQDRKPRFFRDLNRLVAMVRNDFSYEARVQILMRADRKPNRVDERISEAAIQKERFHERERTGRFVHTIRDQDRVR